MACSNRLTTAQRQEIGALAYKSYTIANLARRYSCTPAAIRRWLEEGLKQRPNYNDKAGRGAKRKWTSSQASVIKRWAKAGGSTRKIARRAPHRGHVQVSKSTTHRILTSGCHPLAWRVVSRSVKLRGYNKVKRITFCQESEAKHTSRWVFVDGKDLYLYKSREGYFKRKWQDVNSEPEDVDTNPWVFRFYAAIALDHKTPEVFFMPPTPHQGTLAHKSGERFRSEHFQLFIDWLKVHMQGWYPEGTRQPSLVLDHARQHTSNSSVAYMRQQGVQVVENYPPQAWDLNVIENIWAEVDKNLLGAKPSTSDGWRRAIQKAWGIVPQSLVDKRVKSVNKRMRRILDKDGEWLSTEDMKTL